MIKILGIGNPLRGDDGVALAVLERLTAQKRREWDLQELSSDAFGLLEHLLDNYPVILIDSAEIGKEPGEYACFDVSQVSLKQASSFVSTHGFSFAEVLLMARGLGSVASVSIVAVQPESLEFGTGLSESVRKALPAIEAAVLEEIKKYEAKDSDH